MMQRTKTEEGWVLVTAIAVMAALLMLGLATLKVVDNQTKESGVERVRESSFNLAEGLLYAQGATLRANWPTKAPCGTPAGGCGYVAQCDSTTALAAATLQCPNVAGSLAGVQKIFNNQDVDGTNLTGNWTVQVRDDVGATATSTPTYDKTVVNTAQAACGSQVCTWDANKNRKLWVRVDATVRGKTRSLVALLQLENFNIPFAKNAVVGGTVNFNNNGNKVIVDATGSQIVTRCVPTPSTTTTAIWNAGAANKSVAVTSTSGFSAGQKISIDTGTNYEVLTVANPAVTGSSVNFTGGATKTHQVGTRLQLQPDSSSTCQAWNPGKTQLSPSGAFIGDGAYPAGLTAAQLEVLKAGADSVWNGTCPSTQAEWSGKVFIESTPAAGCTMNPAGNANINSATVPGFVVVASGKLIVKANALYYGVLYVANPTNSCNVLLDLSGNPTVIGGVAVDGCGGVILGSGSGNEPSVRFDPTAFQSFSAVGAAGLVQNTWRELVRGQ